MASIPDYQTAVSAWFEWCSMSYSNNPEYRVSDKFEQKAQEDLTEAKEYILDEIDSAEEALDMIQERHDEVHADLEDKDPLGCFEKAFDGLAKIKNAAKRLEDQEGAENLLDLIVNFGGAADDVIELAPSEDEMYEEEEDEDDYEDDDEFTASYRSASKDNSATSARRELGRLLAKTMTTAPSKKEILDASRFFKELANEEGNSTYGEIADILKGLEQYTTGKLGVQRDGSIPKNNLDKIIYGLNDAMDLLDKESTKSIRRIKAEFDEDVIHRELERTNYQVQSVKIDYDTGTASIDVEAEDDEFSPDDLLDIVESNLGLEIFENGYDTGSRGRIYYVDFYLPDEG